MPEFMELSNVDKFKDQLLVAAYNILGEDKVIDAGLLDEEGISALLLGAHAEYQG